MDLVPFSSGPRTVTSPTWAHARMGGRSLAGIPIGGGIIAAIINAVILLFVIGLIRK
jgi:uncharacterized membrane protein